MRRKLILSNIFCFVFCFVASAQTPHSVLASVSKKLQETGLECNFSMSLQGKTTTGTMKCLKSKFAIVTSATSIWYNGVDMWTYSASSGETTLIHPTKSELTEVNPLEYLQGYKTHYAAVFKRIQPADKFVVVLVPRSKKENVKRVDVTIDKKTLNPESFKIRLSDGSIILADIKKLRFTNDIKASAFVYPASRYPKVEVIDLR